LTLDYTEGHRYNTGRGTIGSSRAYIIIYKGSQILYREPLGEGNPALQSLHSNIHTDIDTMQGEGTIGKRESYSAELTH
ncbi:hypothetical protein XELAEV_18004442mg, partial [Xenopus laevis]